MSFSDSPRHLLIRLLDEQLKKLMRFIVATAFAGSVFPVPGFVWGSAAGQDKKFLQKIILQKIGVEEEAHLRRRRRRAGVGSAGG